MHQFSYVRLGPAFALVASVAVLLLAGCNRPVGSVSGKVMYQGKPLNGGSVSFVSTEGNRSYAAGIKEDGTYTVPDLLGGSYKVCVETSSLKPSGHQIPGGMGTPAIPKGAKTGAPADAPLPEGYIPQAAGSDPAAAALASNKRKYVAIPEKYAKPDETDLAYTFKGGAETFDIELK